MKNLKTIIALICAVSCLIASSFVPSVAAEAQTTEHPTGLTEIYPIDFGIDDGVYTNGKSNTYSGDSLIGTIFTADIKNTGATSTNCIFYASNGGWHGLVFHITKDTIVLGDSSNSIFTGSYTFTEEIAGCNFYGETFRLGVSMEACDSDQDGENDDIKVGIFFNYKLYDNKYIYMPNGILGVNGENGIGNNIVIRPNVYNVSDTNAAIEISSPERTNSDNYLEISPADFGVLDGEHADTEADINVGLNGKGFKTNVSLKNTGDYIDYSGIRLETNELGGITISDSTGNNSFERESIHTDISDLTVIEADDFGVDYGYYGQTDFANIGGEYSGDLENTFFTTKIKFMQSKKAQPSICYGGWDDGGWTGIQIKFLEDVITVRETATDNYTQAYTITPEDLGISSFGFYYGSEKTCPDVGWSVGFDLGISIRYGDYDGDGLRDDLQYGIWLCGKLVQDKYAYVMNLANTEENTEGTCKFGSKIKFYAEKQDVTEEVFDENGNATTQQVTYYSGLKVSMPTIYPALDTENFDLEIVTKDKDFDGDTNTDDLEAKIYIDDTLYKTVNITDYKTENKLSGKFKLKGSVKTQTKTISYKDEVLSFSDLDEIGNRSVDFDSAKVISGGLKAASDADFSLKLNNSISSNISINNFGIADGTYSSVNSASGSFSGDIVNSKFSVGLNFAAASTVYYAGKSKNTGISFTYGATALLIKSANGTLLERVTARNAGIGSTFLNTDFVLGITLNVADTDSDGNQDDIKIGIWFNDTYYKTYTVVGGASDIGQYVSITSSSANYKVTAKNAYASFETDVADAVVPVENKTEEIFAVDFAFSGEELILTGSVSSKLPFDSADTLSFDLWVQPYSLDDDKQKNDIVITLYINGVELDNRSYFIKDIEENAASLVYSAKNIELSDRLPEDSLEAKLYSLHQGDFLLIGSGDVWINRENGHLSGEKISTAGEYTIVRTFGDDEYVQKVNLWKTGYINADNDVNILDFIAAMRYISGNENATYVKKGADLDFDGSVTARDIVKVKRIVMGIDTIPQTTLNDKWSFKEDTMPIVGFFAPTTSYIEAYSRNITPNLCTDKVYKAIADCGFNFLSYIESYYHYQTKSGRSNIKNLELASKYGMGALVLRNDVESNWTDAIYARNSADFSHYNAFEGMVVVDEPHGSGYPDYETANTIDDFITKHSFTKYANMYGYTNMLPYVKGWAGKLLGVETKEIKDEAGNVIGTEEVEILSKEDYDEVYIDYLREFCEKMQPKNLCWDYYVLNGTNYLYYYKNLKAGRQVAAEYGIPFWAFLQTHNNTAGKINSKEEMLWNINTMLAFGLKGVQYYYLVQPHWEAKESKEALTYEFQCEGIIAANGEKTPYYDHALAANTQIKAVDHVLMNSDSKAVLAIGEGAQAETELYETAYGCLTSATATAERGAIIGCFDYRGKQAFYVSSNSFDEAQTVKLTFDKSHSLELISTNINYTVQASEYTVNLGAGEGVLIIID